MKTVITIFTIIIIIVIFIIIGTAIISIIIRFCYYHFIVQTLIYYCQIIQVDKQHIRDICS